MKTTHKNQILMIPGRMYKVKPLKRPKGAGMTEKELKQLFFLNKEIEKIKEEIEVLGYQTLSIPIGDGMPKGKGGTSDKVGRIATEIVYLKDKLELKLKESYIERNRIEQFLDSIEDREIRLIFRLRHVNCMNWRAIGRELGYEHTTVFKKYRKYFQQIQQKYLI